MNPIHKRQEELVKEKLERSVGKFFWGHPGDAGQRKNRGQREGSQELSGTALIFWGGGWGQENVERGRRAKGKAEGGNPAAADNFPFARHLPWGAPRSARWWDCWFDVLVLAGWMLVSEGERYRKWGMLGVT